MRTGPFSSTTGSRKADPVRDDSTLSFTRFSQSSLTPQYLLYQMNTALRADIRLRISTCENKTYAH